MKEKMWLTALGNLIQIKEKDRTEMQNIWFRILKSRFMYYIFMYCIPGSKWVLKALEYIIKHQETIKMAMSELYPISFLFTPFMFGHKAESPKISN